MNFKYLYLLLYLTAFLSFACEDSFNKKLKEGYAGKIDTIPFAIGAKSEEIIKRYGKPTKSDYFSGWYYISYKDVTYFLDLEDKSSEEKIGAVGMIGVGKGFRLFGVQIGMNMQNIQKIIGKYDFKVTPSVNEEDQDELIGGDCAFYYQLGGYELVFTAKNEMESTNAAYLWKRKEKSKN